MFRRGGILACAMAAAVMLFATSARGDLITDGSFEDTANIAPPAGGQAGSDGIGMIDYNTSVTGWSNPNLSSENQTGYNFVFSPATASTSGSVGYNGAVSLDGPPAFNNGLVASPDGGNFIGAEADPTYNGPIQQTVAGLSAGQEYTLSFYWAAAQLSTALSVPSSQQWQVSLGAETQLTSTLNLEALGGFSGWKTANMTFTATAGSEVLSFLATEGNPAGGGPMTLLDGVSLAVVPEPASLGLMAIGLLAMLARPLVPGRKSRRAG